MSQVLQKAEKAVSSHEPGHKPHGSKEATKLGRGHDDHKSKPIATVPSEGKTAGSTKKPYPDDIMTSGTVGAHSTEMADRVEQRVVPDHKLSESKGGGAHGHHGHGGGSR